MLFSADVVFYHLDKQQENDSKN